MSASDQSSIPPLPKNKNQLRRRVLLWLALVFILLAVSSGAYWFLVLRHYMETDDAYVAGNQVQIMSQIKGSVTKVWADNTDYVEKGAVLVTLDDTDAHQAFEKAKTGLATSVRQIRQLMINSQQLLASIALQKTALAQAQADLDRRIPLAKDKLIGREELQHAQSAVDSAKAQLDVAIAQYHANQAIVLNTPVAQQPTVKEAATNVRDKWLDLQRTKIISPINGYVSRRSVQVGAEISSQTPLMVIVPASDLWVDANFKETQLAQMRIGQPATIISDFYGTKVQYQGKVVGIDMGTGSAFSLLPAQNATGNWIKVVQRLPVRIALDPQQLKQYPLRIGLSMAVSVDIRNTSGAMMATQPRETPVYQSSAREIPLDPVNQIIDDIIKTNAG